MLIIKIEIKELILKEKCFKFFFQEKSKFDLILIKQTIHLMKFGEIKKLLKILKKSLNPKGKILIFTLDMVKMKFQLLN